MVPLMDDLHGRAYFDHAATTPLDERVLAAMMPYLTSHWGNPSSIYAEAREARRGLDAARRTAAEVLHARPNDVVFTSGGSESDNLALRGVAAATPRRHIITTAIEHHAVLHAADRLAREGFRVTYLPVDGEGFVDLQALERALDAETALVSVMYANNEVGTIEPLAEAVRIVKSFDPHIAVHTDAVQAAGMLELDVERLGVDLLSLTAHKFYGPKGVGALYVRPRTPFLPQIVGGSQERNRRAGTEDVAGAVGLATALRLAYEEFDVRNRHYSFLRDRLLDGLPAAVPGAVITGARNRAQRLSNNASFCLGGIEGEAVLLQLDLMGFAASSGSACTTASLEPSHVLTAMGIPADLARSSLRLTVGRDNGGDDVDRLLAALPGIVAKLRALSPLAR